LSGCGSFSNSINHVRKKSANTHNIYNEHRRTELGSPPEPCGEPVGEAGGRVAAPFSFVVHCRGPPSAAATVRYCAVTAVARGYGGPSG
jgi:hypothetical protein